MKKEKTEALAPVENEPTGKSKSKKVLTTILNVVINILIVFVLIVSLLIAVMALTSKETGISTIFGFTIQTIQSDSMKGGSPDGYEGGDFEKGDLLIGKSTDFSFDAEYEVGDIITYRAINSNKEYYFMAHRIVDKIKGDDGAYHYQTWGDNRKVSEVPDQLSEDEFLPAYDIGSVLYNKDYHCTVIKGLGGFFDKLKTDKLFFFLIIMLPMILFFLYALLRVILNAKNYKKSKVEEEKEEAVKEAVAAALADKEKNNGATPDEMTPEQMEQFKQFLAQQEAQKAALASAETTEEAPAESSASTSEEP